MNALKQDAIVRYFCFIVLLVFSGAVSAQTDYPTSTIFSDNIWFFGNNQGVLRENQLIEGIPFTSKGVFFKKEKNNTYVVYDASKISRVNSWENSLSVSTPSCDGDFIFYASHDKIYNSNHEAMPNGTYLGHSSTADGIAAAYLGDNKYILAVVSFNLSGNLNYNIIDMSLGEMGDVIPGKNNIPIDASNQVGEAIEMIPVVGTYNKYWLLYFLQSTKTIEVLKVDGELDPASPQITHVQSFDMSQHLDNVLNSDHILSMRADPSFRMIALSFAMSSQGLSTNNNNVQLMDFDPATGIISHNRAIDVQASRLYNERFIDFEFHGKYLYISSAEQWHIPGGGEYFIYQYDLDQGGDFPHQKKKVTNTSFELDWAGGGIKKGPDGKIYFIRQLSKYMGVINKPDEPLDAPNNFDEDGLDLISQNHGVNLSTGLTRPWIDPIIDFSKKPVANVDVAGTYDSLPITIKPLDNDVENAGDLTKLSVTLVEFVNNNDSVKLSFAYNATSKEVTFTQRDDYTFTKDTMILLTYNLRDRGTPVQLCEQGTIKLVIRVLPKITLKDSCSFQPKISIDIQDPKMEFMWQKYDGTVWADVVGSNDKIFLSTPEDGLYRVKVSQKSDPSKEVYTKAREYKTIGKYNVSNRNWYQATLY